MTGSIKEREINNQIEEVRKEILRLAAMENMDSAKAVRARESEKRKKRYVTPHLTALPA